MLHLSPSTSGVFVVQGCTPLKTLACCSTAPTGECISRVWLRWLFSAWRGKHDNYSVPRFLRVHLGARWHNTVMTVMSGTSVLLRTLQMTFRADKHRSCSSCLSLTLEMRQLWPWNEGRVKYRRNSEAHLVMQSLSAPWRKSAPISIGTPWPLRPLNALIAFCGTPGDKLN